MRRLIVSAVLAAGLAAPAAALETARQLVQSGAPQLALNRVEQLQPRDPKEPRWAEWEALRFGLLFSLGREREVLARAAALPPGLPDGVLRELLTLAARSAVAAKQGETARAYAARVLWQLSPAPDEIRAIRLLVIESYVADRQAEAAFHGMLRYAQDYQPLERTVAASFVEALIDLGRERDAVNWLSSLEDGSAAKQMLLLATGLLAPDAAIAQARAQIAKRGGAAHWRIVAEAAARRGDRSQRVEALEHVLQLAGRGAAAQQGAAQLWQAYVAGARDAANQHQLLSGDDGAWYDFAARRLGADPVLSRVFFAYLVDRGQIPATRQSAQLQLVFSLQEGKLDIAALRLFEHASIEQGMLDAQARYRLGAIAEARDEPVLAVRFWDGIDTPPGVGIDDWQLRLATVHWRAGNPAAAMAAARRAADGRTPLSAEAMQRAVVLGREIVAAGKLDQADALLEVLLPLAAAGHRREILSGLGRIAEATGQFSHAAAYYLRSALLGAAGAPDAAALQARLAAALNLARAGYKEDARAQFEWLLRNSKDAAQLEVARRELAKL